MLKHTAHKLSTLAVASAMVLATPASALAAHLNIPTMPVFQTDMRAMFERFEFTQPTNFGSFEINQNFSFNSPSVVQERTITLDQLGLLQLAAHDLFDVDRTTEVDRENGKLDLSTLLDHGKRNIAIGGEHRNRENVFMFSVAKRYGSTYLTYLSYGMTPSQARNVLTAQYHSDLRGAYSAAFGESMPIARKGNATMTENLALRTIHDFIPGQIVVRGRLTTPVDRSLAGTTLTKRELSAKSEVLDGIINPLFRNLRLPMPNGQIVTIDLLERDESFGEQFNTTQSFGYFMSELEDGSYDRNDKVMVHIRNLFAKGLNI